MDTPQKTPNEKAQEAKRRTHELASIGGLVQVAKRYIKDKGMMPPDAPTLVGVIIEGMERLQTLPAERVEAIRNLGFVAMNKKHPDGEKIKAEEPQKNGGRVKFFYQKDTVDPNLNI